MIKVGDEIDPACIEHRIVLAKGDYVESAVVDGIEDDLAYLSVTVIVDDGIDDREDYIQVPLDRLVLAYEETEKLHFTKMALIGLAVIWGLLMLWITSRLIIG